MTGRRCTPAQFIASWKSPRDVEPSPNQVSAARRSPRSLNAIAEAGGDDHHVGQHRDHPDAADAPLAEVHVAVAPARDAARAAHVLAEDARRRDAADEVRGEVAVQDAEPVGAVHRPRGARGDGLLAEAVVEGARDLALAVEHHRPLLDAAHREHRAQETGAVVQRQVLAVRRYLGGFRRHTKNPFLVRAIRDPPARPMEPAARAGSPPRVLPCPGQGYPPRGGTHGAVVAGARALAAARGVALARLRARHPGRRGPALRAGALRRGAARADRLRPARGVREPLPGRGRRAARGPPRCAAAGPTCRARSRRTTPART